MIALTGYGDRLSARPGETVEFKVSAEDGAPYRVDIVRLRCGDTNPAGPGYKEEVVESGVGGRHPGRRQAIRPGSCVVVPWPPALTPPASFGIAAMLWPTLPRSGGFQAVLACRSPDEARGFALGLDETGAMTLVLEGRDGRAVLTAGRALPERRWAWVGATFDRASGRATVFQRALDPLPLGDADAETEDRLAIGDVAVAAPIVMGARLLGMEGERPLTADHYNGKIDSPRLARAALGRERLTSLQHAPLESGHELVAAWDFSRDMTTARVRDAGPNRLDGTAVNLPARGMTGWNWRGQELGWPQAPALYGAIHFHDDDLYDAGWETDFRYTVPPELRSGLYAARLRGGAGGDQEEYIPFYVRAPAEGGEADIVFLAPTASYMAYADYRLAFHGEDCEINEGRLLALNPQDVFLARHPEYGLSLYDLHRDGSGVCYSSRLRPDPYMRPKAQRWDSMASSFLRQFNADTHLLDWLEAKGHRYDVVTDEDLHREGVACLAPYRVVITGSHPEYHSARMLDALAAFTAGGGRLMYMGGNGLYWRIAFSRELPGVIEVRREGGTRNWQARPGELHLGFSGEPGGLWRHLGRPAQALVGVGYVSMGFDRSSPLRRLPASFDPRAAFIFEGIGADEAIGDFGLMGDGVAGIEIDRADVGLGTPPHALVLASSVGEHSDAYRVSLEDLVYNSPTASGTMSDLVRADMVFFETPHGGGVFSVGSITWFGGLAHNGYDNNVSRITDNVLRRFAAPEPLHEAAPPAREIDDVHRG